MRIAILTSDTRSLIGFRGPLIKRLVDCDFDVYTLAPCIDEPTDASLRSLGARPIAVSLNRTSLNPVRETVDLMRLAYQLKRLNPDCIISHFLKPVVYGGIASRLVNVPKRFAFIEGLGYAFTDTDSQTFSKHFLRFMITNMLRQTLPIYDKVYFLNPDDVAEALQLRWVRPEQVVLLPGIGVDLEHYAVAPPVMDPVCFLWMGRLLREKGLYEFIGAARMIRSRYPDTQFILVGDVDVNPGSVSREEVLDWVSEGLVEWPGWVNDVRPWLSRSSVFVLPSYREGAPRSIQEAMAMGRPVITTDSPGCRETVRDGVNGFLVPPRSVEHLAEAMERFIQNRELIARMGINSRQMAVDKYDVTRINEVILDNMGINCSSPVARQPRT